MSSRRRSPERRKDGLHSSSSRASASSKLRMDRNPALSRITDPSEPAGRRREIDNVMKKARASPNSNGYWDKKLLEVEEKDPNRWRHSGYKALYIGGSSSPSPSRRNGGGGGVRRSRSRSRTRRSPPPSTSSSVRNPRPRSPPPRSARSISASSLSSCSDDSCSVCSPKHRGKKARSRSRSFSVPRSRSNNKPRPPAPSAPSSSANRHSNAASSRSRPRGPTSPPPPESSSAAMGRARSSKVTKPTSAPTSNVPPSRRVPSNNHSSRSNQPVVVDLTPAPRTTSSRQMPLPMPEPGASSSRAHDKVVDSRRKDPKRTKVLPARVKTERKTKKPRRNSPAAESSGSEDSSSCSDAPPVVSVTRLTLSERFGKMAQWSVDRRDIENMRITKNSSGGDLKVMIEEDEMLYGSPPPRFSHSPAPVGHYPDELMTSCPSGLASWDDVRVRYQYYKERGYLRDLTLDDYIKWEEWWYKYQEWLKAERYYEHWMSQQQTRNRRRKRLPATQRLN